MPSSDSFAALEAMVRILSSITFPKIMKIQRFMVMSSEEFADGLSLKIPVLFLRICEKVSREHFLWPQNLHL